jgi:hypothetical protein
VRETPFDPRHAETDLGEEEIAELLRAAGPGDRVPDDQVAPIRARAREAWRGQVRRTAMLRGATRALLAVAAAVALTVAVALLRRLPAMPDEAGHVAAAVETVIGGATLGPGQTVVSGAKLADGATVTTASTGRAALQLASGPSVRIDVQSSVRIVSGRSLRLDRGAVYVDTRAETRAPGSNTSTVEIDTPFGTVTDRGTRFEVRLVDAAAKAMDTGSSAGPPRALAIRVREGEVRLATATATYDATAGSELLVERDGEATRGDRAPYGDDWSWVENVRPPVAIEGITCTAFLDWAARETGRRWRYTDPAAGSEAGGAVVHGSIDGLTVDEALDTVLPSCGLRHRVDGGLLLIDNDPG